MKISVISDIHANLSALESVLLDIERIGSDYIICLGDIVGYGPDPEECIELIKERKIKSIMGNHDAAVCGILSTEYFNNYAKKAIEWTINKINYNHKLFLKNLENEIAIENILFIHGALNEIYDYILTPAVLKKNINILIEKYKKNICVFGHTHVAFLSRNKSFEFIKEPCRIFINDINSDIVFINPGSVGQPRGGSSNYSNYCILNTKTGEIDFRFVKYDVKKTYDRIISFGLPRFLADRLIAGY